MGDKRMESCVESVLLGKLPQSMERMMSLFNRVWPILFFIVFLTGCHANSEVVTPTTMVSGIEPTAISPDPGLGGVIGSVGNAGEFWSGKRLTIYAAEFYGDSVEEGVFLLEPMLFPKSILSEGNYFQINNIPPKKYLLLVGPNPESALFVREGGVPLVVEVYADQIVDVGRVEVGE
jgi:hypothetical protein